MLNFSANSQNFSLEIKVISSSETSVLSRYKYQKNYQDSLTVLKTLQNFVLQLQEDSFLAASIDSVFCQNKQFHAYLHIGKSYKLLYLNVDKIPKELLEKVNYNPKKIENKPFYYKEFLTLKTKLLQEFENNGYPFAKLYLDSIYLYDNQNFAANVVYEKGTYIRFDSLLIVGKNPLQIKKKFLTKYLKLVGNQAFSQKKINDSEKLLKKLLYLKLLRKPEITFEKDRAFLILHTEALKINQFDGIIGLLPNAVQNNQLQFTGQVNLKLYNLFQTGKTLLFEWQSPKAASQLLNLSYEHPNLFNSGLDITSFLNLNKRDTSFVNFGWTLQLAYHLGGNSKVFAFTEFRQSTSDSSQINQAARSIADTKIQLYGLGYEYQNLDDLQIPRNGWHIRCNISAGNKEIKPQWDKNDDIYKTLQLQSTQIQLTAFANKYIQTGKKTSLLLRINSGILFNQNLFINELFQLGGIRSLRGFNELAFYSPYYVIGTSEYRLYFEQSSSLFAFIDYAFLGFQTTNQTSKQSNFDTPLGFGGGLSFATKAGVFSFVLAMGQSQTQNIGINQTKIHFGLVTRF